MGIRDGKDKDNDAENKKTDGLANPHTGAGSGTSRTSPTDGDSGPRTTTSTSSGLSDAPVDKDKR